MQRLILVLSLSLALAGNAFAAIKGEPVEYKSGNTVMKGYVAYDDAVTDKRPGVLVVHDGGGHNDYARGRARQLAALGYTALAVDMYGDGKTADHPDTAGKFSGEVKQNWAMGRERFQAAYDTLANHPTVDKGKMAAIGYCFGGSVVLEMARAGMDLDGVVAYHAELATATQAEPGKVKAKIQVYNGTADPFIKPESVEAFKKEMDAARVDYEYINMEGAKHAYSNPAATELGKKFGLPVEYNAAADKKSWEGTKTFFDGLFK